MNSIGARLSLAAAAVLLVFLGLTGLVLQQAFRDAALTELDRRLQAHVYGLLAAAEDDPMGKPRMPALLPDPDLNRPDSGLFAQVTGLDDAYHWRSPSLLGRAEDLAGTALPGESRFAELRPDTVDTPWRVLHFGVAWETLAGTELRYSFAVAADLADLELTMARFRGHLWLGLGLAGLVLLALQAGLLHWGLGPLRRVAGQVKRIEQGEGDQLTGPRPRELSALITNLNSLIRHQRGSAERQRARLDDLAHSLKTPIAVLRGASGDPDTLAREAPEQLDRIQDILDRQLQQAGIAGRSPIAKQVELRPLSQRLLTSLAKVYRDRDTVTELAVPAGLTLPGDEGDLLELFGNLLDNAFKYGRGRVRIAAEASPESVAIVIEDDGPGISAADLTRLLQRGQRADQRQPGQGIGLAVAGEIVKVYAGEWRFESSGWGGLRVELRLPA